MTTFIRIFDILEENLQDLLKNKDNLVKDSKLLSFFNNNLANNLEIFEKLKEQQHGNE